MRRRRDGGYTLMVSMLIIFSMVGLGVAAAWLTQQGTSVAGNLNARQAALNAANAGVQHARQILASYANNGTLYCPGPKVNKPWSCALAGRLTGRDELPTSAGLLKADGTIKRGAILFDGNTALDGVRFPNLPCTTNADCDPSGSTHETCMSGVCSGLGSYTVWVRNDPAEINLAFKAPAAQIDDKLVTDNDAGQGTAVIVRSEGMSGEATVVVEAAVTAFTTSVASGPPNQTFGKNVDQNGTNTVKGGITF